MPAVCVLMPALNAERSVGLAVRSTLAALPRDAELVVLNDGSTDRTAEILDRFADSRLRILTRTTPSGVCAGLNHLLDQTDSAVVARMDADDVMLPWRLRQQWGALRGRPGVVFSAVNEFGPRRFQFSMSPSVPLGPREFPAHLLLTNPVAHPAMLATRAVIDDAGGYRDVPAEDYDLWLRLALAGVPMRRLALTGLLYRRHPSQVTASPEWRQRSWANEAVRQAYTDLAIKLTGVPLQRLVWLAAADLQDAEVNLELERTSEAVRGIASGLSGIAAHNLVRMLGDRLAWVRQYRNR